MHTREIAQDGVDKVSADLDTIEQATSLASANVVV